MGLCIINIRVISLRVTEMNNYNTIMSMTSRGCT